MRENTLRLFGEIERRNNDDIVDKISEIRVEGNRTLGRSTAKKCMSYYGKKRGVWNSKWIETKEVGGGRYE